MGNPEIKIFYSWQSDLPGSETRNLIQDSIKEVVKVLRNTVEIEADRDTKGEYGAPDIVQTIFSKIDECDIFIADVSAVCEYHPVDKDGNPEEETKLTPNPNVLMELGYAAHVVGWENIICIVNTDYGDPKDMPFDIAHRRLTPYSLDGTTKGEIKRYIRGIIQDTVENLLKNGKRVKPQFSNIQVGSYLSETKEIHKSLIHWNLREASSFLTVKQSAIEECKSLIESIRRIHLLPSNHSDEVKNDQIVDNEQETIVTPDGAVLTPVKPILGLNLFKAYKLEISDENKESISSLAKQYLDCDVDIQSGFFCLGNLKKQNTFDIHASYELDGTADEKEKYNKIGELEYKLHQISMWDWYLDTFDGLIFLPLAVKNESTVSDKDISISLSMNTDSAEIVLPTEELINPDMKGLEGIVYEEGILKMLLMMPESTEIQYDSDISFALEDIQPNFKSISSYGGINGTPQYDSEDYARELAKYIAEPLQGSMSEFSFNISSLHAKETKWLGAAILIKPVSGSIEITYSIKSNSSDGSLAGTLTYRKVE